MTGPAIFGLMIWVFYLRFTVPVLGVFYGTSLMADEVEDKTITYLFTRPIRRGAVLFGKYLAYLACTVFVVLPSVMLVYLLVVPMRGSLGGSFIDLSRTWRCWRSGWRSTGRVFAFVGAKFKRPLLIGLIFIFGWEQAALAFPGYLKRFTVAYYLQGLVPHAMPNDSVLSLIQGIFRESPRFWAACSGLALIWSFSWPGGLGRRAPGIRAGAVDVGMVRLVPANLAKPFGSGHLERAQRNFLPPDLYNPPEGQRA